MLVALAIRGDVVVVVGIVSTSRGGTGIETGRTRSILGLVARRVGCSSCVKRGRTIASLANSYDELCQGNTNGGARVEVPSKSLTGAASASGAGTDAGAGAGADAGTGTGGTSTEVGCGVAAVSVGSGLDTDVLRDRDS